MNIVLRISVALVSLVCCASCSDLLGADFDRAVNPSRDAGVEPSSAEPSDRPDATPASKPAPEPPTEPNPDGSCPAKKKPCGGLCVSFDDPTYGCTETSCIPCSIAHAIPECTAGVCTIQSCKPTRGDCDQSSANGCEVDLSADAEHCGSCSTACSDAELCSPTGCTSTCATGLEPCGKSCVDTNANPNHCSACDTACSAPSGGTATCSAGNCGFACNAGFNACAGKCIAESTNACGAGCTKCVAPQNGAATCAGGTCGSVCNSGYSPCTQGCCAELHAAGGDLHACAVLPSGAVKCWGYNQSGELGNGTTTNSPTPVQVSGLTSGVRRLAVGGHGACAITASGALKCWGVNGVGQVGDGTTTDRTQPVVVSGLGSGVADVTAGASHACALLSSGVVKCWGQNNHGQLGDGSKTNRLHPVTVGGLPSSVTAIAAGGDHTCALSAAGTVKCWGYNFGGAVGDGTFDTRVSPVSVTGLSNVRAISLGKFQSCALSTSGGVKCWGGNSNGELGVSPSAIGKSSAPISVPLASAATKVSPGTAFTCALLDGGSLKCWGANSFGQLGDGSTVDRYAPVGVIGLSSGVVDVGTGDTFACAALSSGALRCWGTNSFGELGAVSNDTCTIGSSSVDCSKTPLIVGGL